MNYVFRFGDNPDNMEIVGMTKGYPIYGKKLDKSKWDEYEEARNRKIVENCRTREELGNPSSKPPFGYKNWDEYYFEVKRK